MPDLAVPRKLFTWLGDLGKMLTRTRDEERVLPQWAADFRLLDWGPQSLFWEYLEMGELLPMSPAHPRDWQ